MIQLPNSGDEPSDPTRGNRHGRVSATTDNLPADDVNMASVLEALRKTKAGMQRLGDRLGEPLAIVGIGCRFPDADSPDAFWDLLRDGRSASTHAGDRWSDELAAENEKQPGRITANLASWLDSIDQFDASFFGISGREAASLDPQQRLLLEVAWETLEHAGITPQSCRGRRVGAFVGMCSNDYLYRLTARDPEAIDTYMSTGNAHGAAAGRLSYVMDWRGPSMAVDTACSSSLTAVHLAARSLRYGDCELAIAMGVNVILAPELSISLSQAGMLSPTGRCHAFSSAADGFVRGEGCGAVLLKRFSDAVKDNDSILAVIRGTATNQDGRSVGLTAPNGHAQQAVIRAALSDARLSPDQIDYIETHGTGTPLGDPIEVDALRQVFAASREPSRPLKIGSVKTNLGHLEGAAGIAGLIRVVLSIKNQSLPPHLHCDRLSDAIDWSWPVEVTRQSEAWQSQQARIAGVSSFGFGGSNAHVIVAEAPRAHPLSPSASSEGTLTARTVCTTLDPETPVVTSLSSNPSLFTPSLFVLSAKTPLALRESADRFVNRLQTKRPNLADVCFSAATTRDAMEHRLAIVADSLEMLIEELKKFVVGDPSAMAWTNPEGPENRLVSDDTNGRLRGVAMSFLRAETIAWAEHFEPTARRILLPTYPFQRTRRWFNDSPVFLSQTEKKDAASSRDETLPAMLHRKLNLAGDEVIFETELSSLGYLSDHVVRGMTLFPAAGYVELALAAASVLDSRLNTIENLIILRPVPLRQNRRTPVQIVVQQEPQSTRIRISVLNEKSRNAKWKVAAECHVVSRGGHPGVNRTAGRSEPIESDWADHTLVSSSEHYAAMTAAGLHYGHAFHGLTSRRTVKIGNGEICSGETRLPAGVDADGYRFHPAWLDACLQVAAGLLEQSEHTWIPVGFGRVQWHQQPDSNQPLHVVAKLHVSDQEDLISENPLAVDLSIFDLNIVDPQGRSVLTIERLSLKSVNRSPVETSENETADTASALPTSETTSDENTLRRHLHGRIAEIMGLQLDEVPLSQSLDALGLDSLMAFELRDELQQDFGIEVPLDLFFEANMLDTFLNQVIERIELAGPPVENEDGWVEGAL